MRSTPIGSLTRSVLFVSRCLCLAVSSGLKTFAAPVVLSAASAASSTPKVAKVTPLRQGSGFQDNITGHMRTGFSVKDSDVWQNQQHEWRTHRIYQGQVKAVILDWAGTVLDSGVYSPAVGQKGDAMDLRA